MDTRRPKVLVAVSPPLLADLLSRAIARAGGSDVYVKAASPWAWRRWDVAVVAAHDVDGVHARYIVCLPGELPARMSALGSRPLGRVRSAPDFASLVELVVRLCSDEVVDLRADEPGDGVGPAGADPVPRSVR